MTVLIIIAAVIVGFFVLTFAVYWFNLDTKLVHKIFPLMTKHYDSMARDKRL